MPFDSEADGVNVAVVFVALSVTEPATAAPPVALRVTVDDVRLAAVIGSLNTITTGVDTETPPARFAGDTDVTTGGTSSRTVNENENGEASAFPAASRAAVVIVTTIPVALGRIEDGANSAVRVAGL